MGIRGYPKSEREVVEFSFRNPYSIQELCDRKMPEFGGTEMEVN